MKLLLFIIPTIQSLLITPPSCANCKFYKPHSYHDTFGLYHREMEFDSTSFSRCTYYGIDKYVDTVRNDDLSLIHI